MANASAPLSQPFLRNPQRRRTRYGDPTNLRGADVNQGRVRLIAPSSGG
jgi:hypothetical protein